MVECVQCGHKTCEHLDKLIRQLEGENEELRAVDGVDLLSNFNQLEADRDACRIALEKINDIRNSIVGTQTVNWSEHIYPLVAALNEVGIEGLPYPEARENMGTLLERVKELELQNAALRKANESYKKVRTK